MQSLDYKPEPGGHQMIKKEERGGKIILSHKIMLSFLSFINSFHLSSWCTYDSKLRQTLLS